MSRTGVLGLLAAVVTWGATAVAQGAPGGQAATAASPMVPAVHADVDRTAIWAADRLTYTITIVCAPGVDILRDDVAKEKLRVSGLEILSSDATAVTDDLGRTTHEFRFVLTTYRVDATSLGIEPLMVRYYAHAPGERQQEVSPAGELQVPGAAIALRSTLAETAAAHALRDRRRPAPAPQWVARAQQVGIGLVLISLAPVVVGAVQLLGRRRAGRPARPSVRTRRQEQQVALARLGSLATTSAEERRQAYDEVSASLRRYIEARTGLPASALTTPEIDASLAGTDGPLPRERISRLLAACDAGRYAPIEETPSAEACREVIAAAAQVLGGR